MQAMDQLANRVTAIPGNLQPWTAKGLKLKVVQPNAFGLYFVKQLLFGRFESEISVTVLDENGTPLDNVAVLFGFHTGKSYEVPPVNHPDQFGEIKGNLFKTFAGQAKGMAASDGQEVAIIDYQYDANGGITAIERPTDIVVNIPILGTPPGDSNHSLVHVTFQRFTTGVLSIEQRLAALEAGA